MFFYSTFFEFIFSLKEKLESEGSALISYVPLKKKFDLYEIEFITHLHERDIKCRQFSFQDWKVLFKIVSENCFFFKSDPARFFD